MNLTFEKILAEAEKGDKDSQYELAYMYQFGRGTSIELKEAFKWYNKAANQGHKSALNILKTFRGVEAIESYEPLNEKFDNARAAEENTDEIIYDEEIKLLLAYAYKGNYNAQYDMGIKILSGIYDNYGMSQSDKNKWISLVAENGDFDAQIRLSKFFINKNVKRSFLFQKVCLVKPFKKVAQVFVILRIFPDKVEIFRKNLKFIKEKT